jgi:hypothetical protein
VKYLQKVVSEKQSFVLCCVVLFLCCAVLCCVCMYLCFDHLPNKCIISLVDPTLAYVEAVMSVPNRGVLNDTSASLLIKTPNRELKLTAPDMESHALWYKVWIGNNCIRNFFKLGTGKPNLFNVLIYS